MSLHAEAWNAGTIYLHYPPMYFYDSNDRMIEPLTIATLITTWAGETVSCHSNAPPTASSSHQTFDSGASAVLLSKCKAT